MQQRAALIERNLVRIIDMAGAERDRHHEISVNMKVGADVPKFVLHDPVRTLLFFLKSTQSFQFHNIAPSEEDCKKTASISGLCRKYSIFFS